MLCYEKSFEKFKRIHIRLLEVKNIGLKINVDYINLAFTRLCTFIMETKIDDQYLTHCHA